MDRKLSERACSTSAQGLDDRVVEFTTVMLRHDLLAKLVNLRD